MPVTRRQHDVTRPARPGPGRDPAEIVRNAFRRRAEHAIEHIARSATVESLADALTASTDFGTVARALADPAAFASALPLDPLTDAWARGAAVRERLAVKAGGLLSAEDAGRALGGISRQAVDKRRRAHQLLGVRVANDWRYPAAQIGPDGQVVTGLAAVLEAFAGLGPWVVLDFLLAADDALGGATPLEALRQGGDAATEVDRIIEAHKTDVFG